MHHSYPIYDLHCDLLLYLSENHSRSPLDPQVRCSYSQLVQGGVACQVLAIFTETEESSPSSALAQAEIMHQLQPPQGVKFIPAIENASGLCNETEEIELAFHRLETIESRCGTPLYIGFTWNHENRFGGGCHTSVGLKPDGQRLLEYLHQKKSIAVDFSHASDQLAQDILSLIDKKGWKIPLLASHSNFRTVHPHKRNLPDEIALELIRRGGIIGLNLCVPFIGTKEPEGISKHIEYALKLGGEASIALGADFFYDANLRTPSFTEKYGMVFYPQYGDSGSYPRLLQMLQKESGLTSRQLMGLASGNVKKFLVKCDSSLHFAGSLSLCVEPKIRSLSRVQ